MKASKRLEERYPDAEEIAKQMKDHAASAPFIPIGVPSQDFYHVLPDGLRLCFTLDDISGSTFAILREISIKPVKPKKYWHLSIYRKDEGPTYEEAEFWTKMFFEKTADIIIPGTIVGSRHFFWSI